MKSKVKIVSVVLIGLLMAGILVLSGCGPNCQGTGDCIVTISQGNGLYVDQDAEMSHCGDSATWDANAGIAGDYTGGCLVTNQISWKTKAGTIKCDC